MKELYDDIGINYSSGRKTDPNIAAQIHPELKGSGSILNIGAGSGSYEPQSVNLTAIEPSNEMIKQRAPGSYPVCRAKAEYLPFADNAFSHSITILSMHHWKNRIQALAEIKRVTVNRFITVTWDPADNLFWLTRDYFPEIYSIDRKIFPKISEFYDLFENVTVKALLIPAECRDGFMAAYWRKPHAYLDKQVRDGISTFHKISNLDNGLHKLEQDLKDGRWLQKYAELLKLEFIDVGYKIIVIDF